MKFLKSFFLCLVLPVAMLSAQNVEPIVILGGGVGSLCSAVYLGRSGLTPLVIEGPMPGGLLTQSHSVQNWPGEIEISGALLTEKMHEQAEANGARFLNEEVIAVDFSKRPFVITTRALDGSEKTRRILTESCIIAMGTKPNFLGIPGEEEFWGHGVTNCAICDGSLYRDKIVGVVGGGDAAVLEALYLANIAKEVHIFVRRDMLRAVEERRVQTLREKPNVTFHFCTTVEEVLGDGENVTGVVLKNGRQKSTFDLDGLFLAIGSTPNSAIFKNALKMDQQGYILLQKDQETSVKGVYAIGDIVDPVYKQAVSAAGDGAKAALQANQYLSDCASTFVAKNDVKVKKKGSKNVIEVASADQFHEEIELSTVPVLVDFYATWCGPCKQIAPVFEAAATQFEGKVKFLKVNVDSLPNLSADYNIRGMPTVVMFDSSGKETARKVGSDQIKDLLGQL